MNQPFDEPERQALLQQYVDVREKLFELTAAYDAEGDGEVKVRLASAQERVQDLCRRYEQGVPVVPLSRCPFTGVEVRHSIDSFGLDGPWWDYDSPGRPMESLPPTYFALAGAVRLSGAVEEFPFLCRPGPEVPYVVPRLLEHPHIKAVISSVQVGRHTAFPIFYFADPVPDDVEPVNTWGTDEYTFRDGAGVYRWGNGVETPDDLDFDLEQWIRAGKLLWIAPGDRKLILRADVRRCPYLGLSGRRAVLQIDSGRVWTKEDLATVGTSER